MADAEVLSVSRICKICTETTLGSHFGVDACRACAAFFRRSIVEKKRYSCRTGGKCTIDKYGSVAPEVRIRLCFLIFLFHPFSKAMANYRQLCSVRRATELALEPATYKKMNTKGLLKGYALGTSKHMSLFFRAQISPVTEFVASTYDEFHELTDDEKWNLLQPFFIYLWWFDCAWRTYKLVPREDYTKICVVSETMYLDVDRVDEWIDDISPESEFLRADFVRYLKKEMSPEKMQISYGIDDMKIREQEWVTLVGLMLWNTSSVHLGCTQKIRDCIKRARAKMYEDIHEYYRNCSEPSPAVRLGELMNLHSMTMVELMRSREDLEIFNTLDAFKKDDFFYEMVRKIR